MCMILCDGLWCLTISSQRFRNIHAKCKVHSTHTEVHFPALWTLPLSTALSCETWSSFKRDQHQGSEHKVTFHRTEFWATFFFACLQVYALVGTWLRSGEWYLKWFQWVQVGTCGRDWHDTLVHGKREKQSRKIPLSQRCQAGSCLQLVASIKLQICVRACMKRQFSNTYYKRRRTWHFKVLHTVCILRWKFPGFPYWPATPIWLKSLV